VGSTRLTIAVDATQRELPVSEAEVFRKQTDMNTVVIGDELVRYEAVSPGEPGRLLGCQRGAWGTTAAAHAAGATVAKLMDHGYKVFLTDPGLTCSCPQPGETLQPRGTRQDPDGLEAPGPPVWVSMVALFTRLYDGLSPSCGTINDASNPGY
jgi:hypothetical protein